MSFRFPARSLFCLILLVFSACATSPESSSLDSNSQTPIPEFSKDVGLTCLEQGDLTCARENYCGLELSDDPVVPWRCCLSAFLEDYFSDTTYSLAKKLGYQPLGLQELKKLSPREIAKQKGLLFGELFLLSQDKTPELKTLLKGWGVALSQQQVSTKVLREEIAFLGKVFESGAVCLDKALNGFGADTLSPEFFNSPEALEVGARDLWFAQFFLGVASYGLQGLADYEWGFETFPKLPLSDEFIEDINGWAGEGDLRFGSLDSNTAGHLAARYGLLIRSFEALRIFSEFDGAPSKLHAYLHWRFSAKRQKEIAKVLRAAYDSLQTQQWEELPDRPIAIRLSSLSQADSLPNSLELPLELAVLQRDRDGKIKANGDFFHTWLGPVLHLGEDVPVEK